MKSLTGAAALVLLCLFVCAGCAELIGVAGSVAVMGIDYTAKNCPRRTITCELECAHAATLEALESMAMEVTADERTPNGYKTRARAKGLKVTVELVRLTPSVTKIGVDAAKNIILRDGATAEEVVTQVERALERRGVARLHEEPEPRPAQHEPTRPAPAPTPLTST